MLASQNLSRTAGRLSVLGTVLMATALMGTAQAQSSSQNLYSSAQGIAAKGLPGISFGSPIAFGAGWGAVGVGLSGATIDSDDQDTDGSAALVFGVGDPSVAYGVEFTINVISLTDNGNDNPGDDGNVGIKLASHVRPDTAVAVGVDRAGRWGRAEADVVSVYGVVSHFFSVGRLPAAVNFGFGGGRFEPSRNEDAGVFGGLAINPIRDVSFILDWAGNSLNTAVSWAPVPRLPLTVTVGAVNVTERLDRQVEFAGSLGYGFTF